MEKLYLGDSICFIEGQEERARIKEIVENDCVVFQLFGVFSGETTHDLLDELISVSMSKKDIVLDMEKVQYISSSVLEVFLRVEKKAESNKKTLKFIKVNQNIFDEFKKNGMHELFDIEVMA